MKGLKRYAPIGFAAGILNGLFGAGGGIIVVPLLERTGIEAKKAHATSIAIISALSIASGVIYYLQGKLIFGEILWYLPTGALGAVIGAFLLKKISNNLLRIIFGVIMIISAVRLLLK